MTPTDSGSAELSDDKMDPAYLRTGYRIGRRLVRAPFGNLSPVRCFQGVLRDNRTDETVWFCPHPDHHRIAEATRCAGAHLDLMLAEGNDV